MTRDVKPPFYWERQMARIGRAVSATRAAAHRHQTYPLKRTTGAGFHVSPRVIDLGLADYCEI